MSGATARRAPSRHDVASLSRAFRPGRLAAAFLLAAFSFALAPGASAQDASEEDLPGVTVSPTYLNIPEGQSRSYTVSLDTRPTASVRVRVSISGDQRDGASEFLCCGRSSVWFGPNDWGPRTFTVSALEEPGTADGTLWVRHWAESSDPDYHAIPIATVTAKAKDNDVPATVGAGVTVSATALRVPEGGSRTYTVVLNARPNANVSVRPTVASGDESLRVTPPHATFRASDWSTPRTFTVSAAEDSDADDGAATITHAANSSDPGYDGNAVSIASVRATEQDDDRHGITVSPTALAVPEGGSRTFSVVLNTRPTARVWVAASISGDADLGMSPSARWFFPSNWNVPQTFTVSAAEDADVRDGTATITFEARGIDGGYRGIAIAPVAVTEDDNDTPGITVSPTYLNIPEGQSRSYTVSLATRPTASVRVRVSISGDQRDGASEFLCCGRSSVWFGPNDWGPRTFTVSALEENGTADGTLWVRHWAESDDPDYHAIPIATVTAKAKDNDVPATVGAGVTVSTTALRVPEGGSRTYTVVLDAQPNANVTVRPTVASGDESLSVTPPHATFRASDWSTPRTFTVSAAEDSDTADGTATITHAANSSDPGYNGNAVSIASVRATEDDDDVAGVTVSVSELAVPEGGSQMYIVVLDAQPNANVVIRPTIAGDADLAVTPALRTFTRANWSTPQHFTVSAAEDVDGHDGTATITHAASGGGFGGVAIASVAVTEEDNDTPGVTVSQTYLDIPEGESRSYTVVLNTRPTASVRVRVAISGDQADGSEFRCCGRSWVWLGPDDWNHPETFTVTAPEDPDTDDGTLWVRHWTDSSDPDYHAIPVATVTARALDDDTGLGLGAPRDRTATVGRALGVTLPVAGGGSGSYSYALTGEGGAARPSWLEFNPATRRMSGTPQSTAGAVTLDYTVTDGSGASVTQSFTVAVAAAPSLSAPSNQTFTAGTAIQAFNLPAATGGAPPLRYELSSELPGGLVFFGSTRRLTGIPQAATAGPVTVTYKVTDANGATDSDTFTVTVNAATTSTLALGAVNDLALFVGAAVGPTLPAATGAVGTVTYKLERQGGAAPPTWLDFDETTRFLDGVAPAAAPAVTLVYSATDDLGTTDTSDDVTVSVTFTVTVYAAVALGAVDDLTFTVGVPVSVVFDAATGGVPPLTYALEHRQTFAALALDGLTFNRGTRTLSGTPETATSGAVPAALTVTDATGVGFAQANFTITINAAPTTSTDTTLSALTLTDGSGNAVALDQTFAAATTTYTASVANDVTTVTVAGTANAAGATVAYTPADDDTSTAGHQVDLDEGANEITATVTDGSDTGTYTITVTRAGAAGAQTLVSNIGQSHSTGGSLDTFDHAQAFTTGDNAGGYTLTAVDLQFTNAAGTGTAIISASVWSATAGGQPDTSQGALTNPGSVPTNQVVRFTTSGIDLDASTTYIVVFDAPVVNTNLAVSNTNSDSEDAGAASGWSIGDGSLYRAVGSTTTTWTTFGASKRIAIIGTAKAGTGGTEAPTDGLEARFGVQPAWHTGMPFWTELHFSAEPDLGYKDLRDKAFEVTGARITRAQRMEQGSSRSWRLLVEPSGFGDVSLSLPATEDCAAEGAVCTAEGEPLETGLALAVPGPGDRLAARLKGTSSHDGEAFHLKLHFSQEPNLSYRDVRDTLFAVTGGRITRAKRLVKGSNLGWRLTVEPEGVGAVGLELPATEDCSAEGAVCTRDGRKLERGISWTVAGPPAFSVSDAEVEEAPGAALAFEVSLSRRVRTEARVDVATVDGTATAGADYEAVTRTLVFAPGETVKTVEVTVLDDAHDEGEETMTLVLSNAEGALIDDAEGTGTIVNNDAIPKAWIARFGRTVTGQVLDAVEARLAAPREAGGRMSVAGYAVAAPGGAGGSGETGGGAQAPTQATLEDRAAVAALGSWTDGARTGRSQALRERWNDGPEPKSLDITRHALVTGTSFTLTGGSAEGGGFASLWGHASVAGFDGREDALTLDGEVTTGFLGADWAAERWTAGLALGHSAGTGGYRNGECEENGTADSTQSGGCGGRIEAELTGLYPYAGLNVTERVSVWLAGGHGAGELTVIPDGDGAIGTDLSMRMGAGGTRIAVLGSEGSEGFSLALKGDGRFTRTSSDAARAPDGGNLAEAEADVWLLRFGVEGSRRFALGRSGTGEDTGASLTPSFELALRRDGGDAETGLGADMGGGLALAAPERGLRFDLKGRALVAHEAPGFREWGASAGFGFDPRPSTERGLSVSLTQALGASPSGGMDALLDRETLAGFAAYDSGSGFEASSRLTGELGYGLPAFGGGFTGTPNIGFGLSSGGARDWRLGWRLTPARPSASGFEVTLDATRRESADADAEDGVALRSRFRW